MRPNKDPNKATYRIQNEGGTFWNTATEYGSWFTLEKARKLVNRENGQRVVEHDGEDILWEVMGS